MLKLFFAIIILPFSMGSLSAQFDTTFAKTHIRQCADSLATGFKTKNWELFTRYSYPALVGSLGGKKEFIQFISSSFNQIPDSAWKQYEPGKILQVIKTGRDMQALIELHSILQLPDNRVVSTTCLVAESWDGGLFWTFFDSQGDIQSAKAINPNLSDELKIPAKKESVEPPNKPVKKNPPAKHQQ